MSWSAELLRFYTYIVFIVENVFFHFQHRFMHISLTTALSTSSFPSAGWTICSCARFHCVASSDCGTPAWWVFTYLYNNSDETCNILFSFSGWAGRFLIILSLRLRRISQSLFRRIITAARFPSWPSSFILKCLALLLSLVLYSVILCVGSHDNAAEPSNSPLARWSYRSAFSWSI